jgi:hypothetical protein
MDYPNPQRRLDGNGKRLVMDDQDNMWASGPGDRVALIVFFIGVALLAAGVVMYFAAAA